MSLPEVIVVGAGIAGLSCARELTRAGARVRLIERSRGVGGRCATRRVQGQPIDHGIAFYHGSDKTFHDAVVRADEAGLIEGWPQRISGNGQPCQPRAYDPKEWRYAFDGGVNRFPKSLASDLDILRNHRVASLQVGAGEIQLHSEDGTVHQAPSVVLALAAPQARSLLINAGKEPALVSARALLEMVGSSRCLTLLAGYPLQAASLEWDICYPETSRVLQLAVNDSAKRKQPRELVLVYQALPAWSNSMLGSSTRSGRPLSWEDAGHIFGKWATAPNWTETHIWRYARADHGSEFVSPVLFNLEGGGRLGLAGETFCRDGGVQAAWISGARLAQRLIQKG